MLPKGIFEKLVAQATDLPAMSVIASKAVKLVSSDTASAKDLGEIISRDQAIATKVLKLANSALYSFSREITSIREAVVVLGFKTLKSLLLTVSYMEIHGDMKALSLEESLMWKHSIATALFSREIVREIKTDDPDELFTAGLIHDIGKVILSKYLGSIFSKIFQRVYNEEQSFNMIEKNTLGFTHNELGAAVLRKWQFPDLLIQVVQNHNDIEKARASASRTPLIVYCANRLALAAGYGKGHITESDSNPPELISDLKMRRDRIDIITNQVNNTMAIEDSFLQP